MGGERRRKGEGERERVFRVAVAFLYEPHLRTFFFIVFYREREREKGGRESRGRR